MVNITNTHINDWLEQETRPHAATPRVRVMDRPLHDQELPLAYICLTQKFAAALITDSPHKAEIQAAQNALNPVYWTNSKKRLSHSNLSTKPHLTDLQNTASDYFTSLAMPSETEKLLRQELEHMTRFAKVDAQNETGTSYRYMLLHSKENCLKEGRATNWHPDMFVTFSIYSHFTGAGVEWLPPDLDHEIYCDEEERDKYIQTIEAGQNLHDAGGLTHRSSQHIPTKGQLSAVLYYSPA